jgi:hypothetical protein
MGYQMPRPRDRLKWTGDTNSIILPLVMKEVVRIAHELEYIKRYK